VELFPIKNKKYSLDIPLKYPERNILINISSQHYLLLKKEKKGMKNNCRNNLVVGMLFSM